jgi:gliding motility-associated protein GldE
LLEKPDRLKATLIISNVFLKIAVIGIIIIWLKYAFLLNLISVWGFMIFIIILSLALYIFGEVIPKLYAQSDPYRFSIRVIYPIYLIFIIINPIVYIFTAILNLFSVGRLTSKSHLSAEDLSEAIEFASNELEDGENLFKGIVKFGNINVSEIIKPRVDVVAIEHNLLFADVFAIVVESEYSRIPVFSGNFDNIMGILYVKDLIPYLNDIDKFQWQTLVRPPYFVPETKKVKELLTEFQTNKIHMAIIVDEYGGTLGIVTLEDILEEIVGEISDESDDDEKPYSKINDNIYLFDGKTSLNDLQKILQTDSDVFDEIKGEADTLAGMIIELKGTIPSKNELIHYKQFIFKIEAVDTRRIKQIRVTIVPE